ncbi:DUF481 domain-containing protein, partial [Nitrospinota bacterium]
MKNGDRITGKILAIEDDAVVIETPFSGKVRVSRAAIKKIEPNLPSRFIFKTGNVLKGDVLQLSKDSLTLRVKGDTREITNKEIWAMEVIGREKSPWSGSVAAGLSLNEGNADTLGYNVRGTLLRETFWSEFRLKGGYFFEDAEGSTTTDRADGDARFTYFFKRPWFYLVKQRVEKDRIADIDIASDSNAGLGLRVIDEKATRLDFELGPGYQFTRFENGDREESATARFGSLLRITFPKDVKLEIEGEYIQAFKDGDDFIVRADANLKIPVRRKLNFNLLLQERFDNTPAPGRERNDLSIHSNF